MSPLIGILLVIVFLFMNAFFVIAEFSLVKVRKSQVDMMVTHGEIGAKYAKRISENINAYLSACQLGITLASLAIGWLGEPAFGQLLEPLFELLELGEAASSTISVTVGFLLITTLHVVVGELIPKSFAIFNTEKFARLTAATLVGFYYLTFPFMWVFNSITNGVMKLFGHNMEDEHDAYTDEEIKLLVDESYRSGLIEESQYQYMDNIFDLDDREASEIMTPRTDMVCLHKEDPIASNLALISETKFTRYPVCFDDKDNIVGFVHIKDMMPMEGQIKKLPIRPIEVVTENMSISRLLTMFQKKKTKIAIIVDEHGGTAGMVTLSDIVAQIIGHMADEYEHEEGEEIVRLEKGHYIFDGGILIDVFADEMGIEIDDMMDYNTLSGFLLDLFDRVPKEGESVHYENLTLTVQKMEAHRIIKVDVCEDAPPPSEEE